jgi:hypothetical protein
MNQLFMNFKYSWNSFKGRECDGVDIASVVSESKDEATLTGSAEPQNWKQAVLSSRPESSSSKELQLVQIAILDLQKILK